MVKHSPSLYGRILHPRTLRAAASLSGTSTAPVCGAVPVADEPRPALATGQRRSLPHSRGSGPVAWRVDRRHGFRSAAGGMGKSPARLGAAGVDTEWRLRLQSLRPVVSGRLRATARPAGSAAIGWLGLAGAGTVSDLR